MVPPTEGTFSVDSTPCLRVAWLSSLADGNKHQSILCWGGGGGGSVTTSDPLPSLVVTGTQGGPHACVVSAQLFQLFIHHPTRVDLPDSQLCRLYLPRPLDSIDWGAPFLYPGPETPLRQSTKAYEQSALFSMPGPKALRYLMSGVLTTRFQTHTGRTYMGRTVRALFP